MPGIVIHSTRSVYWPIPKCACSSIKRAICQLLDIPPGVNVHDAEFEYVQAPVLGYRNFALVRNPYARLYSLWKNKVSQNREIQKEWNGALDPNVFKPFGNKFKPGMDFRKFVDAVCSIPVENSDPHFAPQYLCIPEGGQIQFCKMEDVELLSRSVLGEHNKYSENIDEWKSAFRGNPDLVKKVQDYYSEDFKRFRYSFHPFHVILVDCDGVLTDGTLTITHDGEKLFKKFNTRDVRAIRELIYNGFHVVIVSADDWPGIFHFADKVGAEVLISKDKKENGFTDYIAIGDDAWDAPMLAKAALAFAPADADPSVFQCGKHVNRLQTPGGRGVMAEVVRILIGEEYHEG